MDAVVHGCGHDGEFLYTPRDSALAQKIRAGERPFTIDLHCHIATPAVEMLVKDMPQKQAEPAIRVQQFGEKSSLVNARIFSSDIMRARLANIDTRLNEMEAMGVDLQLVSASPGQYYYWADYDLAAEIVRLQNENIAEVCAKYPKQFLGLGAVSPQHPELAVTQLETAVTQYGLKGLIISTLVGDKDLSDPSYEKFWAKAEELNAVIFIHPLGSPLGERINSHYLGNIIGQPIETTIALSKLIFDGVLDRHPALKLLAAHGGGYLPAYIGRTDHGYAVRPEIDRLKQKPSDYLKQIYFDNLVYKPEAVKALIAEVGLSQVVVGTDYPFDMGQYAVHEVVDAIDGLAEAEKALIFSGNAARLLNLEI